MVSFSDIILVYLVIGIVMFGGGAIDWDNAGVAKFFVDNPNDGDITVKENATEKTQGVGGAIKSIVDQLAGPIVIVWNLAVALISFMNWPIIVLLSQNAPPVMVLMLGVPFNAAFYLSLIRLVRTSA